jgi:hypothetical protein
MNQLPQLDVTRDHPTRGPEVVGTLIFGDVVDFYISEGMQFVLTPVVDKKAGGAVVGLDIVAYPAHYEMLGG